MPKQRGEKGEETTQTAGRLIVLSALLVFQVAKVRPMLADQFFQL